MRARNVTYADLDAFLERLGSARRAVEVDHGAVAGTANGVDGAPRRLTIPGIAYAHVARGALLMLPKRSVDDVVAPRYLHAARRTLVDWDVTSNEEFDRWLCQVQFPDDCAVPTGAGGTRVRAGE